MFLDEAGLCLGIAAVTVTVTVAVIVIVDEGESNVDRLLCLRLPEG